MSDKKYISLLEFYNLGFIQEINRQFLHPRGLALSVNITEADDDEAVNVDTGSGEERKITDIRWDGIWDYRDDPEGILFPEDALDSDAARKKEKQVNDLCMDHLDARREAIGDKMLVGGVQPVPPKRIKE